MGSSLSDVDSIETISFVSGVALKEWERCILSAESMVGSAPIV